jgi:hypothetical protein
VDDAARPRPARRRGFLGEFAAAARRGSAAPVSGAAPAGDWRGRPVIVCNLRLDTGYGARGDALPGLSAGASTSLCSACATAIPGLRSPGRTCGSTWHGRERHPAAWRGMLGGLRLLAERGAPPLPPQVLDWVSCEFAARLE